MKIKVIKTNRSSLWHLKPNYCRCMGYCECDRWAIYNSNGEFVCTIISKELGLRYCRQKNEEEAAEQ